MTQKTVLIVGAGHAGFQVAASLRQHGFGERIWLLNDEAHLPYQRPPLSKAYLKGEGRPDSLMFRPDKFYRDQNIELIADRAVSIDRAAQRLLLASGSFLDYGHLVLATGARNRLLDLPNANLPDVQYLRILDESGYELYRWNGYLPPAEFAAQLLVALGLAYLRLRRFEAAEACYADALNRFPTALAAPEAAYFAAVTAYRKSGEGNALLHGWHDLEKVYPGSVWTVKQNFD